jgi:hypothetical protein
VIDLTVSAADADSESDDAGMTLGELYDATARCINSGADRDGPVSVYVSRLHRVRRIEVRIEDAPAPAAPVDAGAEVTATQP